MSDITLGERITSAVLGAFFGALVGFILFWLLGVFSQTLGPGQVQGEFEKWLSTGAAIFGFVGFIFGRHIGTLLGNILNALFQFEDQRNYEFLNGFLLIIFALLLIGVWLLSRL